MTVLPGDKYRIETLGQFKERLQVSDREIYKALPEEYEEQFISEFNNVRIDFEESFDHAESLGDVPQWFIDELSTEFFPSDRKVIGQVLESRDQNYIHLYDGIIHTIVEVYAEATPHYEVN